jgi:hypothetical protein
MSLIPPILGAGIQIGNSILRQSETLTDFGDAITEVGIELQFYSKTGELTGVIGSSYENSNLVNIEVIQRLIGGIESFTFSIGRLVDIPFFNDQEVRFNYNGVHWFTMFLTWEPGQERRDVLFEFEGKGAIDFARRISVDNQYVGGETLTEIVKDVVENDLAPNSPIIYNESKINAGTYATTQLEFNNNTIEDLLNSILDLANRNIDSTRYRWYIDKHKEFVFEPVSNSIQYGFFEGYQFQSPDIEITANEMINRVRFWKTQLDLDTIFYVGQFSDSDSIDVYGIWQKDFIIPNFFDDVDASRLANSILKQNKDPQTRIEIQNLRIEDDPYPIGFYDINARRTDYIIQISDFENLAAWTRSLSATTITLSDEKSISLTHSFKCVLTSGSIDDYIEFEIEEAVYFPETFIIYVNQSEVGDFIEITLYDEDGNSEIIGNNIILVTQDGNFIVTQDQDFITAQQKSLQVDITDSFFRWELSVTLDNIKKVKLKFLTDEDITIYLDRMDIEANIWKRNTLISEQMIYLVENANIKVNGTFGIMPPELSEDIKEVQDEGINTKNIFTKTL